MKTSKTPEETTQIAQELAANLGETHILYLNGDLGTGKTTFTKGFAEALGIKNFKIKSPTYTYIRKHEAGTKNLYHIDLYRLEQIDELLEEEIHEIMENPNNIIVIEWADRMTNKITKNSINIDFKYIDENSRSIDIK